VSRVDKGRKAGVHGANACPATRVRGSTKGMHAQKAVLCSVQRMMYQWFKPCCTWCCLW